MPELPEVETVKRGLSDLIIGREVTSVTHDWPKSFPNSENDVEAFLINSKVVAVRRRAKVLLIDLSSDYTLVTHLKMTGQMVFVATQISTIKSQTSKDEVRFGAGHPNESLVGSLPDKSTRVHFVFKDGSHLFFNDQRKFGWVRMLPTSQINELPFFQKVGPEPLEDSFTADVFIERINKRANTTVKAALLDQSVLAGVGNIYADESLWGAMIHPAERVKDISSKKLELLHKELIFVLRLAIEKGGSTDKNYVNAEGKKGSYIDFARVFRREGLACPRCNTIIEKSRVAGRGTHTCPLCQRTDT